MKEKRSPVARRPQVIALGHLAVTPELEAGEPEHASARPHRAQLDFMNDSDPSRRTAATGIRVSFS